MKKYIVLKPGVSIDKVIGMSYNDIEKYSYFIGKVTSDGIMEDEISGSTYTYHELDNKSIKTSNQDLDLEFLFISEFDAPCYLTLVKNGVKIPIEKTEWLQGLRCGRTEKTTNQNNDGAGIFVYMPEKLFKAAGYDCTNEQLRYLCKPAGTVGPMTDSAMKLNSKQGLIDACLLSDIVKIFGKEGICNVVTRWPADEPEGIQNAEYRIYFDEINESDYEIYTIREEAVAYRDMNFKPRGNFLVGETVKVLKPRQEGIDSDGGIYVKAFYKGGLY